MTAETLFPASGIYYGDVVHRRFVPKGHVLKYRIFSLFIDLDKINELSQNLWCLSINRFNLISFYYKDYGDSSGRLGQYIRNEIAKRYPGIQIKSIYLLAMPRILGYVFNPLSIYFCYDERASLRAILYEVSNTFGQRHNYVFDIDETKASRHKHECAKEFYVSPFLEMELQYKFAISNPTNSLSLAIQSFKKCDMMMNAVLDMKFAELSNKNLIRFFLSMPLVTWKVITGIHIEALFLWLKGISVVPDTSAETKSACLHRNKIR